MTAATPQSTPGTLDHEAAKRPGDAGATWRFAIGLRGRSITAVAVVSLLIGAIGVASLLMIGGDIATQLGYTIVERYVLGHKARVQGFMNQELRLAQQLANDDDLHRWARNAEVDAARRAAFERLDSYLSLSDASTYFVGLADAGEYYIKSPGLGHAPPGARPRVTQTLSRSDPKDSWFYASLEAPEPYHVNVDYNQSLGTTKVWFNVVMRDAGRALGVAGTGVDITRFIRRFVVTDEVGLQAMLLNADGAIQGHSNVARIALNAQVDAAGSARTSLWGALAGERQRADVRARMARLQAGEIRAATLPLTIDRRQRLAALAYIPELDWFTLASIDPRAVLGGREFAVVAGVVVVTLLIALAALAWLFNRYLLRPLLNIAGAAERVARGDYSVRLDARRRDELGTVSRTFNTMTQTVKAYTERLESLVHERTQALEAANTELTRTNHQMLESVRNARRIQEALLPDPFAVRALRYSPLWRPRDQVGGDLYVARRAGDTYLIGVIDCTGHGVPGAVTAMAAHSAFNHVVDGESLHAPARILEAMNRALRPVLNPGGDGRRDRGSENGLEMALCSWKPGDRSMRFAGAGLSLFQASGDGIAEWAGDRAGLGYPDPTDPGQAEGHSALRITEHVLPAKPASTYYLATDGYLDQAGGPKGLPYGRRRFRELLTSLWQQPIAQQARALERELNEWRRDRAQRDDVTVLGFQIETPA